MPSKMTRARTATREQRRRIVAANLLAGLTVREMAEALGVSKGTVERDLKVIMQRWRDEQLEDTDQVVQMELKRIDVAVNALWDDVKAGKVSAIDRFVRLQEQRAKFLGLYKPTKVQTTGQVDVKYTTQVREEDAFLKEHSTELDAILASLEGEEGEIVAQN
jgi:hypothetical protein